MEFEKCECCKAEFRPGSLNDDGVCKTCIILGLVDKAKKQEDKIEADNKERVRKIVADELEKFGILQKCECGELFFKRSPAQKSCGNCPNKETK